MKTKIFLIGVLLYITQTSFGQRDLRFDWAINSMQPSTSSPVSIESDTAGNVVSVGRFFGNKDFDPSPTATYTLSTNYTATYIQKVDINGSFLWAKALSGTGQSKPRQVGTDEEGNIYIVGRYSGTVDFNPHPSQTENRTALIMNSIYYENPFVLKLDPNGNFLWVYTAEGNGIDEAIDVDVDSYGNVYATGFFHNVINFTPTPGNGNIHSSAANSVDIFVVKINKLGQLQWVNTTGLFYRDEPNSITVGSDNYVYCSGTFDDSAGNKSAYIQKISPNNSVDYVKTFNLNGNVNKLTDLELDSEDNIYMYGAFAGTTDFDPNSGTAYVSASGTNDDYLLSLNSAGQFRWVKTFNGGMSSLNVGNLSIDLQDNIFCATQNSNVQFQIRQYEKTQGIFIKEYQFNSTSSTGLLDISKVNKCGVYLSGLYASGITIDADPSTGVSNLSNTSNTHQSFMIRLNLEISNLNPAFSYRVCSNRVHVRGVAQPLTTNPYSDWHLIEYFPGTQTEILRESLYWWQLPSPYQYSTLERTFSYILQPGSYYYVKHGLHGECTGWKESRQYGIIRNNVACEADPDKGFSVARTAGGNEFSTSENIEIYPNPTSGLANINSIYTITSCRVLSLSGKELIKIENTVQSIDISSLQAGTYILEIQTTEGVFSKKLIKQ
ncbi:T9SS type A sorting domain-containing protein [Flammeovirga aprica]|uniref:T9SS type A sorting domain-containing protein n=1 Tax=Flammeovirga aprica JL-4 TaxID=694437 RepID=A0A7X9XBS4_9BACT|nr:T9SS type A sorting domain-containing protein [Flammeovirga aprica]NME71052.1 T9SS type A sorting domain-containing protein [Flammeovirga aprica JL-4]